MVAQTCHPSYVGGKGRKIAIWGQPQAKMWGPSKKKKKGKKGKKELGSVAQVVEHLPSESQPLVTPKMLE
jgi:hypothetical protein